MQKFLGSKEYVAWRCSDVRDIEEEKTRFLAEKRRCIGNNPPNDILNLVSEELSWRDKFVPVFHAFKQKDAEKLSCLLDEKECTEYAQTRDENFKLDPKFYKDLFLKGLFDIQLLVFREENGTQESCLRLLTLFCEMLLEMRKERNV
nr:hypothetical protein MarFTME_434 [Marseillevirus futianmevirus]